MTSFENPQHHDPSMALGPVGLLHLQSNLQGEGMVTTRGRLTQESIRIYDGIWTPLTKPVFGGCTDDRFPTLQSARTLQNSNSEVLSPLEAYASIYGGAPGAAKNVLITGIAQYGEGFITKVGGLQGVLDKLIRYSNDSRDEKNIKYVLHSDENNENSNQTFCFDGNGAHGCKYCAGAGAVSGLVTSRENTLIFDVAVDDQMEIFGSDFGLRNLQDAHSMFLKSGTNGLGSDFAINRSDFIDLSNKGVQIMILQGAHAPAEDSGLLLSFEMDEVGSAKKAAEIGTPVYREDVMTVVRDLQKKFKEFDLNPELLARSIVLESTAVRAVLAAGDKDPKLNGVLDPRNLAMGWRGDAREALRQLA